ncbi:MAG: ATP-dependent RecD-like DNA helicase, partial [Candidatus Poribacteria bacterium]|nr:ATP-dependent RecD-like DNA helicase [Candidatus Poribacteria bacterium]
METIRAALSDVYYRNEENGFTAATAFLPESEDGAIRVVGHFAEIRQGELLELRGEWVEHARYGKQFRVDAYEPVLPSSNKGIEAYLASGMFKGVRGSLAERIVSRFGEDTLTVIEETPDRLREVPGIGKKIGAQIHESWMAQREVQNLMVFLQSHGVQTHLGVKIYKKYGDNALNVVRENPYRLAEEVYGVGFRTADGIARKLGMPTFSPHRLGAGIAYALELQTSNGHVFYPKDQLMSAAAELLGVEEAALSEPFEQLQVRRQIVCDGERVYLAGLFTAEVGVANRLKALAGAPPFPSGKHSLDASIAEIEKDLDLSLAPQQKNAVATAIQKPVMALTGGPGTGK